MRKIIFFIIGFILYGCSQNSDPFKDIEFGKLSQNKFELDMISKGILSDPEDDSLTYLYYLKNGKFEIPVVIAINPDGYSFGSLRELELDLGGDSSYWTGSANYSRGSGPRLKEDVDDIYDIYCKWYGNPDSILKEASGWERSIWFTENFKITFNLSNSRKNDDLNSKYTYSSYTNIRYEMIDYNIEYSRIQDSIRKTLTPNDIISISVLNPIWEDKFSRNYYDNDTRFSVEYGYFTRNSPEEHRGVTGIKFDIVLSDKFGEELFRFKDITYETDKPMIRTRMLQSSTSARFTYSVEYYKSSNNIEVRDFEKIRNYSKSNSIEVFADIRAIVFDDGSILK